MDLMHEYYLENVLEDGYKTSVHVVFLYRPSSQVHFLGLLWTLSISRLLVDRNVVRLVIFGGFSNFVLNKVSPCACKPQ